MTGSANNHEGTNEENQSKKENISKPTTRSKMKKLISRVRERLRKIKGRQTSMYILKYCTTGRESGVLQSIFFGCRREIDRSNDIRLRASKTENVLGLIQYELLWIIGIIGMRRAWYVTFIHLLRSKSVYVALYPVPLGFFL